MDTATTLNGLLQSVAKTFPSRRAISLVGKFDITHSHLHELVECAADHLITSGIKPNDVVALTFPNTIEYVILFLAIIRIRATTTPLNAAYTVEEFEFYLSNSESKLLLTSLDGNKPTQDATSKLKIPLDSASLTGIEEETRLKISLNHPDSGLKSDSGNSVAKLINEPSDMALFLHISGTTSHPKGVPLTLLNLVSSVKSI